MKPLNALITGYDGFVGPHLAEHLLEQGRNVTGTIYSGTSPLSPLHEDLRGQIRTVSFDIESFQEVRSLVAEVRPDEVYHLAGISHVPTSWENPRKTFSVNVMGGINLLDSLRMNEQPVKVLIVTSAEVYGKLKREDLPAMESHPLKPENPYAASKAALDVISRQWSHFENMQIIRVRPFSHTGPGQSSDFVCPAFSRQIASISLGKSEPVMKVGDLSAKRDFTDVRDIVRGYRLILEQAENGNVFNICSGESRKISEILDVLKSFSDKKIRVETDPEKLRPVEIPETLGSRDKIKNVTGWEPQIPFEKTLQDIYEYWLDRLIAE